MHSVFHKYHYIPSITDLSIIHSSCSLATLNEILWTMRYKQSRFTISICIWKSTITHIYKCIPKIFLQSRTHFSTCLTASDREGDHLFPSFLCHDALGLHQIKSFIYIYSLVGKKYFFKLNSPLSLSEV